MQYRLRLVGFEPEDLADIRTARLADGMMRTKDFLDGSGMTMTWYLCEEDMRALSARFPEVLFILDIVNVEEPGASPPERWCFKAGKVQKLTATIVFPDFDASKLA